MEQASLDRSLVLPETAPSIGEGSLAAEAEALPELEPIPLQLEDPDNLFQPPQGSSGGGGNSSLPTGDPLTGLGSEGGPSDIAVRAEGQVFINSGGDFDGDPLNPTDDAFIYAGQGFTINSRPVLPVLRDASGTPVLDESGLPVLVPGALTVSENYNTINAPQDLYSNLRSPQVIPTQTVEVPGWQQLRDERLAELVDVQIPAVTRLQGLNTASDFANAVPSGSSAENRTVLQIERGGLTIPDRAVLRNAVLIVERGAINFNGSANFEHVTLIANSGNVNLGNVESVNLEVYASRTIQTNEAARFDDRTILAAGENILFNGATSTVDADDFATVAAGGDLTFNASADTRGEFLASNSVTFNSRSVLYGSVEAKNNITFNGNPTIVGLSGNVGEPLPDTTVPQLTLALANDTGSSASDRLTSEPTLRGTVLDEGPLATLEARINGTGNFADVLSRVEAGGQFNFDRALLETLYGNPLADGLYTVEVRSTDAAGNLAATQLSFQLDTTLSPLTVDLSPDSDTGPLGDLETTAEFIALQVQVEPGATVQLADFNRTAIAAPTGEVTFTDVPLELGATVFAVVAADLAGNQRTATITITRVPENQAPSAIALSNTAVLENSPAATEIGRLSTTDADSGDLHIYTIVGDPDGLFVVEGDRLLLAEGASLDRETASSHSVTIRSTDSGNPALSFEQTFSIEVLDVNEAPEFTSLPVTQAETGLPYSYLIATTDPEGDVLGISATGLPDGLAFVDNGDGTALLSGIPTTGGLFPVELTVTDSAGNSAIQTAVISIDFVLREEMEFVREAAIALTVPTEPSLLSFTLDPIAFDLGDRNSINDALEVSLVDASGNSLLHTFQSDRDAFFNLTEEETVQLAPGITFDALTGVVTANLAGLVPGSSATLIFRLANNDGDTNTSVGISNILLLDAPEGTDAPSSGGLAQLADAPAAGPDFANLEDVSTSIAAEYGLTSFDESSNLLHSEVTLRNIGTFAVDGPLYVVVTNLSDPTVLPRNTAGLTPEGLPYFAFDALADGQVNPGDTTLTGTLAFHNPNRVQFTYDLTILADINDAPAITSDPLVPGREVAEAIAGRLFEYTVEAVDPNGDQLAFELLVAPEGLTIDPTTGLITWLPSELPASDPNTDVGNHSVVVQVSDGRGGVDIQSFTLSTIELPPNRPPIFTNDPEVDAFINQVFRHDADAIDPDVDPISFRVIQGPEGLTIDRQTGEIEFTPPPALILGDTVLATTRVVGEKDLYTFSGTLGQLVYLDTLIPGNNNFDVRVISPTGTDVLVEARRGTNGRGLNSPAFLRLPQTGNYRIEIDPRDEHAGFYGFSLIDAAAVPSIELDTVVSGATSPGTEDDVYRFTGNAGQKIFFDSLQRSARSFRQFWRLYNERGESVLSSNTDFTDREIFLPEDGEYYLVIESTENFGRTDTYTFELITPDEITRPLSLGDNAQANIVNGTIGEKGEEDLYTFEGWAGQRILFDNLFVTGALSGQTDASLTDPNGRTILSTVLQPNRNDNPITLERDGTYTLRIDARDERLGDYSFSVLDLDRATIAELDREYRGSLDSGQETHAFEFTAEAGQRLFLDARSGGGNGTWIIYDAGNNVIVNSTSIRTDIEHVFDRAGSYTLLLRGNNGSTPIEYGFEIITPDILTAPVALDTPISGEIGEKGERDLYTFEGRAGQVLFLDSLSSNAGIRATLTNAYGSATGLNGVTLAQDLNRQPFVLAEDGIYQLEIDGTQATTGDYHFQLLDLREKPLLAPSSLESGTLAPDRVQVFQIEGTGGDRLYFDRQSSSRDAIWRFYGPSLNLLEDRRFNSDFETVLESSGTYYLLVHNELASASDYSIQWVPTLANPEAIAILPDTVIANSLSELGERQTFTFEGTIGQQLYFDAKTGSSNLTVTISGVDGVVYQGNLDSSGSIDRIAIPYSGIYTVRVDGQQEAIGDYAFELLDRAASAQLEFDTPLSGSLDPNQTLLYRFEGVAGEKLQLETLLADSAANLTLYGPDGEQIDIGTGGNFSRTLFASGPYTLALNNDADSAADFALQVEAIATPELVETGFGTFSGTVSNGLDEYEIQANAGTIVYLDSARSGAANRLELLDPNGNPVFAGVADGNTNDGLFRLSETGIYRLQVRPIHASPQPYNFQLHNLSAVAPLVPNVPSSLSFPPNTSHVFRVPGTAGQPILFDSLSDHSRRSPAQNLFVEFYAPDGELLLETDARFDTGLQTLTQTGDYYLVLSSRTAGSRSLNFQVLDGTADPVIDYDTPISGSFGASGREAALYRFSGNAGDRVYFDLPSANSSAFYQVYNAAGQALTERLRFSKERAIDLERAGDYFLSISTDFAQTQADYSFRLVTPEPQFEAIGLDQLIAGEIAELGQFNDYSFEAAAGQRVYFDYLDNTSLNWRLIGPDGSPLFSGSTYGFNRFGPNDRDRLLRLNEGGTYTLRLSGAPNPYQFRLLNYDSLDASAGGEIALDTVISGSFEQSPFETKIYRFSASEGERIFLESLAGVGNHFWSLYDGTGQLLNLESDISFSRNLRALSQDFDSLILPHTGEYELRIDGEGGSSSNYQFQVVSLDWIEREYRLDEIVTEAISRPGERDIFNFEGTTGQTLYFDSLVGPTFSQLRVTLSTPSGDIVADDIRTQDLRVTLTETGQYRLTIDGIGSRTRDYSFRIFDYDATAAAAPIELDTRIAGDFGPSNFETRLHRFSGEAGQRIYIDNLDTRNVGNWALLDENLKVIAGSRNLATDFELVLPETGNYILQLRGSGAANASYEVEIVTPEFIEQDYTLSDTISTSISEQGERDFYTFEGVTGQRLFFDSQFPSSRDIIGTLISPSGLTIASSQFTSLERLYTLQETGTYRLEVDGVEDHTQEYGFRLLDLDAEVAKPELLLPNGEIISGSLGTSGNDVRFYRLEGNAGQTLFIDAIGVHNFGNIALLSDRYERLTPNQTLSTDFERVLPYTGNYILRVSGTVSASGLARGEEADYQFRALLSEAESRAIALGERLDGEISVAGERDAFEFAGVAGQAIYLDAIAGADGLVGRLFSPSGEPVRIGYSNSFGNISPTFEFELSGDIPPLTLLEDGLYRLEVDGTNSTTGSYSLRLSDILDAPELPIGTPVARTTIAGGNTSLYQFSGRVGQSLSFSLDSNTYRNFGGAIAQWALYNSRGTRLGFGQFNRPDPTFNVGLSSDDTYVLAIEENGSAPFDYQFTVTDTTPAEPVSIAPPSSEPVTLAGGESYSFSGSVGSLIYLDRIGGGSKFLRGQLLDPEGNEVASGFVTSGNVGPIRLPSSGEYTLTLNGNSTLSWQFRTLELPRSPLAANSTTVKVGSFFDGRTTGPGDAADIYTFSGRSGQQIFLNGTHGNVRAIVYDADGRAIEAVSSDFSSASSQFALTLERDDVYHIVVQGSGNTDYGFQLLDFADAAEIELNRPFRGSLPTGQLTELLYFEAQAGQRLFFDIGSNAGSGSPLLELYAPDGRRLVNNFGTTFRDFNDFEFVAESDGRYQVRITRGTNPNPFNYEFQINSFDDVADILVPGSGEATANDDDSLGRFRVQIAAEDDRGGVAVQDFTLRIGPDPDNNAPTITSLPSVSRLGLNQAGFEYFVEALDPDGDNLSYRLVDAPLGTTLNRDTGYLFFSAESANPGDTLEFAVEVSDARGGRDVQTFELEVAAATGTLQGTVFDDLNRNTFQDTDLFRGDTPNVHFVIDLSGSVGRRTIPLGDIDVSTVEPRSPLDLELTSIVAFNDQLIDAGLADIAQIAVSVFNEGGRSADLDFDPATQTIFINPNTDANDNGLLDLEERLNFNGNPWAGTSFDDGLSHGQAVLEALDDPANSTLIFLSDGFGRASEPVLEALSASGINVRAFALGEGRSASIEQLLPIDANAAQIETIDELIEIFSGFDPRFLLEPFIDDAAVYLDLNDNGVLDEGEPLQFTTLERPESQLGRQLFTFEFEGLAPGDYTVRAIAPNGFSSTTPADGPAFQFTITETGETIRTNFGFAEDVAAPNGAPEFVSTPESTTVSVGDRFDYRALALDPDADAVTYSVTSSLEGLAIDPDNGLLTFNPTSDQAGTHDVILRARDEQGNSSLQVFQLTVESENARPLFTSLPSVRQAQVGKTYHYQASAIDPDGDATTFSLVGAPNGAEIDAATGLLTWTPSQAQVGSHVFLVNVSDGQGGESLQTVVLEAIEPIPNRLPTLESTPRTSTPIGQTYFYDLIASDADGDALTYSLEQAPEGAVLEGNRLLWAPTAAQVGDHAVSIRVSDSQGGTVTQDFTIRATHFAGNRAPSIESEPEFLTHLEREYRYNLQGSDPDGDSLIWTLLQAPQGVALDPVTGALRWQPSGEQLGSHVFEVQLTDGRGASVTQTFELSVRGLNTPPLIISPPNTRAAVGQSYEYRAVATDLDNDPLRYALGIRPEGLEIDAETGAISFIPTAEQVGEHVVEVQVRDDSGALTRQTFTLVVEEAAINRAPTITSTPIFVSDVSQPYRYRVEAVDPDLGDRLSFSLLEAPAGVTIDAETGLLEWTTPAVGQHRIVVGVRDEAGLGAAQGYVLTAAVNQLPQISSVNPPLEATPGVLYRYDVRATDPDGGQLTYSLDADSIALGIEIDELGRLRFLPTAEDVGSHEVAIAITDAVGGEIEQRFELTVAADESAPLVNLIATNDRVSLGDPITFLATATDNVGVDLLTLAVNGAPVLLQADGTFTLTPAQVGEVRAIASATDAAGNQSQSVLTFDVIDFSDGTPPTVELVAAQFEEFVTAPTDIFGTVTDDNLDFYTLSIAPVGTNEFVEIFRGESNIADGDLGDFDPTLLQNDAYTLRLEAVDETGNVNAIEQTVNVAGGLKLGNFQLSFTDLQIPLTGIPISVTRTYDSLNASSSDDFGFGWRLEFRDTDLRTSLGPDELFEQLGIRSQAFDDRTRVYITLPGGERQAFTFAPTIDPISLFFPNVDLGGDPTIYRSAFRGDAGVTSTLEIEGVSRLSRAADGSYVSLNQGAGLNPVDTDRGFSGIYRLTTREGIIYRIDAVTGDLLTVEDRNGNQLSFSDDGIVSSTGQSVGFERNAQGRIVSVIDPAGQRIQYEYDAAGDLVAVTDRENNTSRYDYSEERAHFLEEITDPLGRTGIRSEYDEAGRLNRVLGSGEQSVQIAYDPDNSLQTVTDALGRATTYVYDDRGNILTEINPLLGETIRTYDQDNNLLSLTNAAGQTATFTYDALNNPLTIEDPLGNIQTFTYGQFSLVESATDALGNTTRYEYDERGNLSAIIDPLEQETRFFYNDAGLLTRSADALNQITQFSYDERGNLISRIDPLGFETSYSYDDLSRNFSTSRTQTSLAGEERTVEVNATYDSEGRTTSITDAEGFTTRYEYDASGQLVAEIDPLDRRTEYLYDDRGLLERIIYPDDTPETTADNLTDTFTYDAANQLIVDIDREGRTTRYEYDELGRLVETLFADDTLDDLTDNPRQSTRYDAIGRVIAEIDELNNETQYEYDLAGRLSLVRDALGNETTYTYDNSNRLSSVSDALGRTTQFTYDALDRRVSIEFVDGLSQTTVYDALDRVVEIQDRAGNSTFYEYDALDRLSAIEDSLEQRTTHFYDELGNLLRTVDANSNVTDYEYNLVGEVTALTLALGQRQTNVYDAVGNLIEVTTFNGDVITYEYNAENLPVLTSYDDGNSVSYTYTDAQLLASIDDTRSGRTEYAYDERYRLTTFSNADNRQITYTYDDASNLTSLSSPAGTTTYTYDPLNRLASANNANAGLTTYTYDEVGNRVLTELGNGTRERAVYDDLDRLVSLQQANIDGELFARFDYALDAVGNRTQVVELDGRQVNYTYDSTYRLLSESISDPLAGDRLIEYSYDAVGNRLTRNDSAEGLTLYTYNQNNQLTTTLDGGGITTTFAYDDNGNLIFRENSTEQIEYTFDIENRLVSTTIDRNGETQQAEYIYDDFGIRVASTVNGEETRYLVDPNRPFAQVLEEYSVDGKILTAYVYGDSLIAQIDADDAVTYFHADGLGSTRILTDSAGEIVSQFDYDAFGRELFQQGADTDFQFAGEQRDDVLELDYLRARYYDPDLGRFISRDPFPGFLDDPYSLHKYQYAHNNPVNNTDPSGLFTLNEVTATTIVGGTLFAIAGLSLQNHITGDNFLVAFIDLVNLGVENTFSFPINENFKGIGNVGLSPTPNPVLDLDGSPLGSGALDGPLLGEPLASPHSGAGGDIDIDPARPFLSDNDPQDIIDELVRTSASGRPTMGGTTQFERPGDFQTANEVFDSLNPSNVRNIPNGRVGQLDDGRTVVVRSGSRDGRPTLELQETRRRRTKFRFGSTINSE